MKHPKGTRKLQQQLKTQNESGLEFLHKLQQDGIKFQRKLLFSLENGSINCHTAKQKHKRRGGLDQ